VTYIAIPSEDPGRSRFLLDLCDRQRAASEHCGQKLNLLIGLGAAIYIAACGQRLIGRRLNMGGFEI
jgi:hypothetical protein